MNLLKEAHWNSHFHKFYNKFSHVLFITIKKLYSLKSNDSISSVHKHPK